LIRSEEAIPAQPALSDAEIIRRISHGDCASFETLMRRFNRKLFRIARAILKDDAEAEEALQEGIWLPTWHCRHSGVNPN
jgi:RNA polymerase sigma-70 factor, ECF subfamily